MDRLTKRLGRHVYYTKGTMYRDTVPAECMSWDVREILRALADYEDTGLTPENIRNIKNKEEPKQMELVARVKFKDEWFNEYRCPEENCGMHLHGEYEYCPYCGQRVFLGGAAG